MLTDGAADASVVHHDDVLLGSTSNLSEKIKQAPECLACAYLGLHVLRHQGVVDANLAELKSETSKGQRKEQPLVRSAEAAAAPHRTTRRSSRTRRAPHRSSRLDQAGAGMDVYGPHATTCTEGVAPEVLCGSRPFPGSEGAGLKTHLVLDDGDFHAMVPLEDAVHERGLARAQEPGDLLSRASRVRDREGARTTPL